LECEWMGSI